MKSDRLQGLSLGIFTELANRKQKVKQQGRKVIDLSVGNPDLPPHPRIMSTLSTWAQDGSKYGYTLHAIPAFNPAVAQFYSDRYNVDLQPNQEILQVPGTQDGLFQLALSIINPGDYALVTDPGYPIYETSVKLAGGRVYYIPLTEENGFFPRLDQIPESILKKAKLLFINFPGNPIPQLAPPSFFEEVVFYAKKFDFKVIHDFTYSELVFDQERATSFLNIPGAKEVGVEFNSLSKTFHMAGCRIGYVVGNMEIIQALSLLMSHTHYGIFYPIQKAAEEALKSGDSFYRSHIRIYQSRRDLVIKELKKSGWDVMNPPATMYIWAKIPLSVSSTEFCYRLMEDTGVVLTPGSAFGKNGEGYVRINLVQPEVQLKKAMNLIHHFLLKQGWV
ncbi:MULTISPECIES: aminotransferase class I/II-fold pyridoxal phosphate-dependent enzyme [unclassified Thermoactinomyces]|jgi:LL-diaminopimelate aminotransferase|uniref:aminotransferase class I/II-fold pyridoxal phosphate-dependent enzyme n=1 Tax=unclassified Thermoactinomyces TaxID=2634588 RepID=UPI0018DB56D7|nr:MULTISPECIES: aminotransferase class I/II-fold pyridoxal phosphate-dependent enzyme [unclassified Thermoactinomyces]MBH8599684.1 aminotransferase class I/II-fold pyridoxal phosphate-dependent enzyme [Thermoactinomyces sp. CICC 10523]MBH8608713.1 aminotransferase class I/II-fold pyridoxal phosphate-dependent enzyme [Thermoactinomyces sp. CICC 10521]